MNRWIDSYTRWISLKRTFAIGRWATHDGREVMWSSALCRSYRHWFKRGFLFNWSLAKCLQTVAAQEIGKKANVWGVQHKRRMNPFGDCLFPVFCRVIIQLHLYFVVGWVAFHGWLLAHLTHKLYNRTTKPISWEVDGQDAPSRIM